MEYHPPIANMKRTKAVAEQSKLLQGSQKVTLAILSQKAPPRATSKASPNSVYIPTQIPTCTEVSVRAALAHLHLGDRTDVYVWGPS